MKPLLFMFFSLVCFSVASCQTNEQANQKQNTLKKGKSLEVGDDSQNLNDLVLYTVKPPLNDSSKGKTAFINVSDTFFKNLYKPGDTPFKNNVLEPKILNKDTIFLNQNQRKQFLKFSNINETDKLFLYQFNTDSVTEFKVSDLPAFAIASEFSNSSDKARKEYDYKFGLDCGELEIETDNIVYIGPEEQYIYETKQLNDNLRANASWRYESLNTLLWALGKVDELVYPSKVCDV